MIKLAVKWASMNYSAIFNPEIAVTLYGIKTCDTIRKARRWLTNQGIEFTFHDFRSDGLDKSQLSQWADELGWELLLNKRSTTWRNLDPDVKESMGPQIALDIMLDQPAIIKRPVLDLGSKRVVGFSEQNYRAVFAL